MEDFEFAEEITNELVQYAATKNHVATQQSADIFTCIALRLQRITGFLTESAGHLAALTLLVLATTIVLGIVLRFLRIDNYWTYDLDLFSLIWLAFVGAVLTARHNHHVTAGIALENFLHGWENVFAFIRFAIVGTFLVMFVVSGYRQAYTSFITHETTLDIVQWPVWIAEAALPLGGVFWLLAEVHKFLHRLTGKASQVHQDDIFFE